MPKTLPDTITTQPVAVGGEAIVAAEDEDRLPHFSMVAYTGGAMMLAGFPHPVVVDLEGIKIPSQRLPTRHNHNADRNVGHTEKIAVEDGELQAEGVISFSNPWSRDIVTSGKNKFPWQASIGAGVVRAEFVPASREVEVNGKKFSGPVHVVRRSLLREISFVDSGADSNTSAEVSASTEANSKEQTMKKDAKDSQASVETEANTSQDVQAQDSTASQDPKPEQDSQRKPQSIQATATQDHVADLRAQAAAEVQRISKIRELCGDQHADIAAQAIGEGWDETKTELAVLRAARPQAPGVIDRGSNVAGAQTLEAAAMMAGGIAGEDLVQSHGEQAVEAADRRFRRGIGLQQLLLEAAWACGYSGAHFRDDPESVVQAAFSTLSLPGILSNVANKFLLKGFMSVESVWQQIASISSVSDFKERTSYRLTGDLEFDEIGPNSEIKHGKVGEESYSNKARTFAKMFGLSREHLINDDMNALSAIPRMIGRGAHIKLNKEFWKEFLDNSAFFKTENKNYKVGTDTALSIAALSIAREMFRKQTDSEGNPLAIQAKVLLVPPALEILAEQLMSSLKLTEGGQSTKSQAPTDNPHAGKFKPVSSAYLDNDNISGGSSKAWYTLADPQDVPVIDVAFLNGRGQPTVERTDADFRFLGIQFRGFFDFGIKKQDHRGGLKMKGEN